MIQSPEVQAAKSRAATMSIVSNTILIVLKLIVGIMMQSVSVISEAVHSGLDLVAAIIAWFSIRESGKPADDEHRFGHGKIENVVCSKILNDHNWGTRSMRRLRMCSPMVRGFSG